MKVLIVNASDAKGGAAKAAYRLHLSLLEQGIDSKMLVQQKLTDDKNIIGPESKIDKAINIARPEFDQIPLIISNYKSLSLFSTAKIPSGKILKTIQKYNPDIVHLHWICGGMIKVEDLAKINKPIVWSLHDMWPFTGGCHYDQECGRFTDNCGICKILESSNENDLSKRVFIRKQKAFSKKNDITIVGISKWLNDYSQKSTLLKGKKHINLPNPIDTNIFKPFDKNQSRYLWDLPKDKKIILFGAVRATGDPRKGYQEMLVALKEFPNANVELVIFGSSEPENASKLGFKTHYLGHIYDDISLVSLYNAVDVMVVPSLQEAFGQTACEAMSCATPVVAFATTGLLDIVDHKVNGYLAKAFDTKDLANGIEWALNASNYDELCQNAREKVVNTFDSKLVAKKYIALYEKILDDV